LRRRIEQLENRLDARLFTRAATGVDLTADGRKVYSVGLEMLSQARILGRLSLGAGRGLSGLVRVGITEGLGAFWLAPRLRSLHETHPRLKVDLRCEMRVQDLSRLECDVAVQLDRPSASDLKMVRLGTLHLILFASEDYVARPGMLRKTEDLHKFRFVELVADQVPSELLEERVRDDPYFQFVVVRTNSSSAHAAAVASGVGIGALPTYARLINKRLIPLETDFHLKRTIWLAYHPEAAKLRRVQVVIEWLKAAFSSRDYPWFNDELMLPHHFDDRLDLPELLSSESQHVRGRVT
jgi:DNA-binding transcriptional LysR family regulator